MLKIILGLVTVFLFSCSAIEVGNVHNKVIIKSQPPLCSIDKVDPNCKVNDNANVNK